MTYSCANLFNYLDQAYDAFYDKSCVDSQDMALNNLFFPRILTQTSVRKCWMLDSFEQMFAHLYQLTGVGQYEASSV